MIVNLYDAKTHLSELVEQAAAGEEIVIAKAGLPRARLVPLTGGSGSRTPGVWQGQVWISDDFDAPLPPELLHGFSGDDDDDEPPPARRPTRRAPGTPSKGRPRRP